MTKFDERLLGKRINVFSESQSVAVQELLFKMGCSWITYNTGKKEIRHTAAKWLFINARGRLSYSTRQEFGEHYPHQDITSMISFIGDEAVLDFSKEENSKDINSTSKFISELPTTDLVPNTVGVSTNLDKQIHSIAQQMREEANEALRKAGYIKKK